MYCTAKDGIPKTIPQILQPSWSLDSGMQLQMELGLLTKMRSLDQNE